MAPKEIEEMLLREGSQVSPDKYDESAEPVEAHQRRTELLIPVLAACREVWTSGSEEIELMVEKLGDGSRDVAWRVPFGDSGILEFFLRVLARDGLKQGLQIHILRLVGNSCADTDVNRARVIQGNHLATIINHLQHESLIPFTIPVLFNILVDYEPAQLAASQAHLNQRLIALLSSPTLSNFVVFIPYFCKILALLITQEGEANRASPNTVGILLTLATSLPSRDDLDDFISLVSVAVSYLADDKFQTTLIQGPLMQLFLSTFYHAHTHFDMIEVDDADTAASLKKLYSSLLVSLADITGNDLFAACYPLQSQIAQTFLAWLQSSNPQLQTAACLALGNLSRSDEISTALVQVYFAHAPLVRLLSNQEIADAQLLHSALSFLKNLAIPVPNKPHLGGLLDVACVPRLYNLDTSPQVQFAAVSLTRLLVVNCPANVARICAPLSADPASPARERSSVSGIITLYERSDAEPTRLEAARAIAAVCRMLHSGPVVPLLPDWEPPVVEIETKSSEAEDEEKLRREYFYSKHDVARVLSFLISQQKWPTLRSEAWFVFALMCRSKEGSRVIITLLQIHGTMTCLIKAVTGRETPLSEVGGIEQIEEASYSPAAPDGQITSMAEGLGLEPQQADPKQRESMIRVDRENALVMCTELLRTWGNQLPGLRLSILQDLVKEGTEIVAAQKAVTS
ncbi:armadillo-type fold domain-containing [Trichoderma arundinaceum]|uniref:Armadillo-type fold domain-containing n=1 Tax=Trichoderma arundinaceum TaxID=490622 RepID=A0A395NX27_TRIAR|nr:armadillo-type fold domain-containing [Trichoderma arundinaceum]